MHNFGLEHTRERQRVVGPYAVPGGDLAKAHVAVVSIAPGETYFSSFPNGIRTRLPP